MPRETEGNKEVLPERLTEKTPEKASLDLIIERLVMASVKELNAEVSLEGQRSWETVKCS